MSFANVIARVVATAQKGAAQAARVTVGVTARSLSGLKNLMRSSTMGKLFNGTKVAAVQWWTADTMMAIVESIIIDVCGMDIDSAATESIAKAKDKDGYILIDRLIYHYSHTSFLEIVIVLLFTIRVLYKARKGKLDPKAAKLLSSIKGIGYGKKRIITTTSTGMRPAGSRIEVTFDTFTISEVTALATLFAAIATEVWDWIAHDLLSHPESSEQTMSPNADSSSGNDTDSSFITSVVAGLSALGSIDVGDQGVEEVYRTMVHTTDSVKLVPSHTVSQVIRATSDRDGVPNLITQSGTLVDLRSDNDARRNIRNLEERLADVYGVSVSNLRLLRDYMGGFDDPSS